MGGDLSKARLGPGLTAIAVEAPALGTEEVAAAVAEQFGLAGDYRPLLGERDQNFHLAATDGQQYVVKVVGEGEDPAATDFRIGVMRHLERRCRLSLPRVIAARDGGPGGHVVREDRRWRLCVVRYVPGDRLSAAVIDPDIASRLGTALAELDVALQGYSHPAERPVLLWDLQRAPELRGLLEAIDEPPVRARVARAIDDFDARVQPVMASLRDQVIHGDANPDNVLLVADRRSIAGFIDFGDCVRAPLVFDVAIAASYLRAPSEPLSLVGPFAAAYNRVLPLASRELDLLYDLVRARLATTVALLYWRLAARDAGDPYRERVLASEADAVAFLAALDVLGRAAFGKKIAESTA